MSEIVFVLGAGASKHCGTPLMNNFLEVAEDLWRAGEVEEAKEDFKKVFDARGKLQAVHSKAKINTYNVEDVFAAFEMGKLLGRLPGIEGSVKIEKLISSIKKVIGYTLERTTRFPHNTIQKGVNPPESYYEFADNIIDKIIEREKGCSVITFNYDLGLDYSLYARGILPDYGLGDIDLTNKKCVTYLKLHGSLNWGKCRSRNCGRIIPLIKFDELISKSGLDYSTIPIISRLKNRTCPSCKKPLGEDPFIVPPTWNKTAYHEEIEHVWKRAALELKDAENIFVLGYSFPDTDMFFRYLFALGVDMRTSLRGFYVYDIDSAVEERFQNLLGSGVSQRFLYQGLKFKDAIRREIIGWRADYMDLDTEYKTIPQILNIRHE